jgi:glycosyltransferase involved in cell wall biosynthesis
VRVLVVSNFYPPHHLGGYELSCKDVMDRFEAAGHAVTVLTTTTRRPGVVDDPDERARGVFRDLQFWWDDHVLLSPPRLRRLAIERANHRALEAAIAHARPDVVSIWNLGAASMGLATAVARRGLPTVFAICDDWLVYGPKLDAWSRMFDGRPRLSRIAERVFGIPAAVPAEAWPGMYCFVSDSTRRYAAEQTGKRFLPSTVVYSGIEHAAFPPLESVPDRPWRWRLLFVGRIEHRKGVESLLRALALLPAEATLDLVGPAEPAYEPVVDALLDELGLRDRVRRDLVPRAELREVYARADVFVFPSTWDEPFGLVPVEAMACGTPVVASGTGGSAEFLVHEGNALTYAPGDPAALAAALRRVAEDAGLRQRIVTGGLALARELSVDRLAEVFEAWHLAAAEGAGPPYPSDRPPPAAA